MGLAGSKAEFQGKPYAAAEFYARMLNEPGPGRPIIWPITVYARASQMSGKLLWQRLPMVRYLTYSTVIIIYIFHNVNKLVLSPENTQKWIEIRKKWELEMKGHSTWRPHHRPVWDGIDSTGH